jgi:hypothetical protein
MTVASFQTAIFGANPFNVDGPTGTTGTGTILPQFLPGHVAYGDAGSEYTYCKLVLGSTTNVLPGQLYYIDDDYNATLLATAASPRGSRVAVCRALAFQLAAGTYYIWLQHAGQAPVAYTTLTANNLTETTATAGSCNSPASPTVSSKLITGLYYTKSPATFTGTVTNGSPNITALSISTLSSGPYLGATITGTGIPASTIIGGVTTTAQGIVTSLQMTTTSGALVNGTATNTGVTITPSLLGEARVIWPYVDKTN